MAPSPYRSAQRYLPTVHRVLLWLAMVCLLPGILGAVTLMVYQHQQSRQQLEQQTQLTARALQPAIDHQLL